LKIFYIVANIATICDITDKYRLNSKIETEQQSAFFSTTTRH